MVKTLHGTLDRNGAGCTVGEFVLASDYAALEARCWEIEDCYGNEHICTVNARNRADRLEAALREIGDSSLRPPGWEDREFTPTNRGDFWKDVAVNLRLKARSALETACEHEWEPVKVTGDNGVIYNCKKCGGTKGWNPGAALEHWESVPNRSAKP